VLQFLPMDLVKAGLAALAVLALVATPARLPITTLRDDRFGRRSAA
jgi:hypothetical protein